jgi:trehalose-phosphatase
VGTLTEGERELAELVQPLRANPEASAVLSDVDGTLAPIADDPAAASVPHETREVLEELAARYALVACVTGRRALEAREIVGIEAIAYAGNHGFELLRPHESEPVPDPALRGREAASRLFIESLDLDDLRLHGLRVEDKGPIQAIHWRGAADEEVAERRALELADAARAAGLVPRAGRKVLEVRPVAGIDKGSAVTRLVREGGARAALFGGDDHTDLDAFMALRWLYSAGRLSAALCVGVLSPEAPEGLDGASDCLVEGTDGFLSVLRVLAAALGDG